jgi:5-formyltetrahydrofolate cyclo-ligase
VTTQPTKSTLRINARKILSALAPDTRAAASVQIRHRIVALPEWHAAGNIAIYAALPSEPDLSPLHADPGKVFCYPRISGNTLEFHLCDAQTLFHPGPWTLLEPDPATSPVIPSSEIDLLCIPGLAFTPDGARLGRGGGLFDRFLTRIRPGATKLGICFHGQLLPALPQEVHDHEVDIIVSEMETIRCA